LLDGKVGKGFAVQFDARQAVFHAGRRLSPQEPQKIFHTEADLGKDASQGSFVKFFVIRNHDLSEGCIAAQNHMAALLVFSAETRLPQGFDAIPSGNPG
jgi:hypothetical protein